MKCFSCEEQMEDLTAYHTINWGGISFTLSHKTDCALYVCTSRDCKDVGIVRCVPSEIEEE